MLTTSWNRLEKSFRMKFIWSVLKQWMMSMSEVINQWNEPANQAHTPIISITLEHFVSKILLGFHGTFSNNCKLMFWYRGSWSELFFQGGCPQKCKTTKAPNTHTHTHTHNANFFPESQAWATMLHYTYICRLVTRTLSGTTPLKKKFWFDFPCDLANYEAGAQLVP